MIRPPLYTQELFDCRDKSLVGGKAENLGRLIRAGFPVPGGFVVTTRAYRAMHCGAGFPACTQNGAVTGEHAPAPVDAADVLQAGKPAPQDISEQIRLAYELMGRGPVAVRSSATAEDGAAASMAGQYETFLHVNDERSLLEAVRCCWASLDSPRRCA
jgi:rifampicin phosphotransferase